MVTEWLYRINVLVPDALKPLASALWTAIAPNGDYEALSFNVPCSADGQEPATHWAMSTAATEEMRTLIVNIFSADLVDCVIEVLDYTVIDLPAFIAAQGLQIISKDLP